MICNNVLMTFNSFPTFSKTPFRLSVIRLVLFIVFRYYLPWLCSQCIANYFSIMRPCFPEIAEFFPSRLIDGSIYISGGFSKIVTGRLRDAYGTLMGCRSINRFDKLNWRKYNPFRTTIPEQWFSMKFQCESFIQCSMTFYCCYISRFPCLFHQVSEDVSIVLNWCQWLSTIWQSVFNA